MPVVVDASVALAWYLDDETSEYAARVLDSLVDETAVVPTTWPLEIANGLLAAERRGRVTTADVAQTYESLLQLPIEVEDLRLDVVFSDILAIARSGGLSIYDACYLDLAMRNALSLATLDDRLRAAATRVGVALVD